MKRIKTIGSVLAFFSRQERPFRVNLFKISIQNFFTSLTQQYQSIYITSLGVTAFQLGVFNSLGGLVGAIMSPPTGWFADKRGIKAVMALGMFPMILGTLFFALAADGIMVIPAVILATLALRIEMTACPMVCGTYLKSEKRAMGMQFCDTLSAVPRLISPIIGAAIVTRFGGMSLSGIRPLYYLQFAGFLLVLLIVLGIFSSPKRGDNKLATSFIGGLREVFKQGPAAKKWIIYSCFSTVPVFVSTTYIPLYAAQVKAVDQFVLSGMATASMIVPLVLSLPTGHWADTYGRKKVIYVTTLLHCTSLMTLILAPNATILLLSAFLQGFFMLSAVTQGAMGAELVPTYLLGSWYGILGLFRGFVGVASPAIGGLIWESIGPSYVFAFLIITEFVKVLLLTRIPETLKTH